MKRGVVAHRTTSGLAWWTWFGSLASVVSLVACGGRTATDDGSWLDDSSLVGNGDVLDVTNAVSTLPGIPTPTSGTGSIGIPNPPVSPRPRPTPPTVPPRPAPPVQTTIPVPTTTAGPPTTGPITSSTDTAPTSDWTTTDDSTFTIEPTWTTEPTTTTGVSSTTPDSTTDDSTVEPPPPFDPLHPPDGQVALGLPPEYADAQWYDTDKCFSNYGWAGSTSCYESRFCDEGSTYINCSENSAGDWLCDCNAFNGYYKSVTVAGAIVPADDTRQACRVGSAICLSDVPPTEPPDCDDYENAYPQYCSRERLCVDHWTSSYGDFTRNGQRAYVECYSGADTPGVASCSCSGVAGYNTFELSSDQLGMCETGIDVCSTGVDEDSLEAVECSWSSRSFGETNCQQSYDCTQQGTSGEIVVSVTGQTTVYCTAIGDGSWSCACNYGSSELTPFSATDSEEACDVGGALCIQGLTNLFR